MVFWWAGAATRNNATLAGLANRAGLWTEFNAWVRLVRLQYQKLETAAAWTR